jgi:hypothetical protein
MIKKRFKDFDLDKDDHLTAAEVQALIRHRFVTFVAHQA